MRRYSIGLTLILGFADGYCSVLGQERRPTSRNERADARNTAPRMGEPARTQEEMKTVAYGRSEVRDVSNEAFVSIEHKLLPKRINGAMYSRVEELFRSEASPIVKGQPLEPGRMRVGVFAAVDRSQNDLVEYRWEHEGVDIRLLSSIDVVQIELNIDQLEKQARFRMTTADYLRDLLPTILRLEGEDQYKVHYQVILPWPKSLEDGLEFSTNPDQSLIFLTRWHQRVDAFVEGRKFFLLVYKKPDQLMNFRDGSKWFSDDFRQFVHDKAREQGKLPPEAPTPNESKPQE